MFTLHIDGEPAADQTPVAQPQYDGESLRIQLEDLERSSGYPEACAECGEPIDDDHPDDHEPREPALSWCNSASVTLDPDDDAIHLSCSVGDPRGAFTFTIRRIPTSRDANGAVTNPDLAGRLIIHHPHPDESFAHMPTTVLHPGTLRVG